MDRREVQHFHYKSHEYDTNLHTSVYVENVGVCCHLEFMKIHKNSRLYRFLHNNNNNNNNNNQKAVRLLMCRKVRKFLAEE